MFDIPKHAQVKGRKNDNVLFRNVYFIVYFIV